MILYVKKFREAGQWCVMVVSCEDAKLKTLVARVANHAAAAGIVTVFRHHQKRRSP